MIKKLYMKTTEDRLELPEALADSVKELSRMTGFTEGTIKTYLSRKKRGWQKVEIEGEEDP